MLKLNGVEIKQERFPDGTLHMNIPSRIRLMEDPYSPSIAKVEWFYENDAELFSLYSLCRSVQNAIRKRTGTHTVKSHLSIPYLPHARMDRVKKDTEVFTLKYFAEIINSLNFDKVEILDPHSNVASALIQNVQILQPTNSILSVIDKITVNGLTLFYPDEGSAKRYSDLFHMPYCFGVKHRDWETGQIKHLEVLGDPNLIEGQDILIIDDICSRGGTFLHSAKELKIMGANKIYLWVTHCENTILEGDLLKDDLIEKVFTTNSIFTKEHPKIEVIEL